MEAEQQSPAMPRLPENRITVLSTAYLLPTSVAVGVHTALCVLFVLPGAFMIAGQASRDVAMKELRFLGFWLGIFVLWNVLQILGHLRCRNNRDWIRRLEASGEVALKTDRGFFWNVNYDKERWSASDVLKTLGNVAIPAGLLILLMLLPRMPSLTWFGPRPLHEFSIFQSFWGNLLFFFSVFPIAPARQGELKVTESGLLFWKGRWFEVIPWALIEKVVWEEPRWGTMQMKLVFITKGFFEKKGMTISFVDFSDEEKGRMLAGLRKYATVETRWVRESGVEQEVGSEMEGVGDGR